MTYRTNPISNDKSAGSHAHMFASSSSLMVPLQASSTVGPGQKLQTQTMNLANISKKSKSIVSSATALIESASGANSTINGTSSLVATQRISSNAAAVSVENPEQLGVCSSSKDTPLIKLTRVEENTGNDQPATSETEEESKHAPSLTLSPDEQLLSSRTN